MVAVLLSLQVSAAAPFSDVPSGKWYTEPITYCKNKGLVSGYKDRTFKPNNNITRAEFCVMLYMLGNELALNKKAADSDMIYDQYAKQYTDYDPNSWYSDAVACCLVNGYISGTSKTTLSLSKNILRQDVAVMIDKMFGWTFEPNTHQGGLCNDERGPDGQARYWWKAMYRFIDLGIYKGDANWNWSNGSAYKNNYPITRAEMCTVFKFILENQNWIDARENKYKKIDLTGDYYFVDKKDIAKYEQWIRENDEDDMGAVIRKYESISKNVSIDSVTIKELNFDNYTPSGNTGKNNITAEEAYRIACEYWSYKEGDVDPETGYDIAVFQDGLTTYNGKQVYQFRARWLVEHNHWSTLDTLYVDADTGACIKPGE